jgi:RNA polymerase sigma-70 factor (ECF subfamily)
MTSASGVPATRPSLLLRIRDPRDSESWQRFVDIYGPLVYRSCRRRGLQDADAAEVMQEVLLQVNRSMAQFEYQPDQGRFRNWLGAVIRSKLSRLHRRDQRSHEKILEEECRAVARDTQWDEEFNRYVLETALEQIRPHFTDRTWQAFEQVWIDRVAASEVAQRLGEPLDRIYVAKSRVLKRLQAAVQELADDSVLPSR